MKMTVMYKDKSYFCFVFILDLPDDSGWCDRFPHGLLRAGVRRLVGSPVRLTAGQVGCRLECVHYFHRVYDCSAIPARRWVASWTLYR